MNNDDLNGNNAKDIKDDNLLYNNSNSNNNLDNNLNDAISNANNSNNANNIQLNNNLYVNNGGINVAGSNIINSNNNQNISNITNSYNSNTSSVQQNVNNNNVNNQNNNGVVINNANQSYQYKDNFSSVNTSEKANNKDIIKLVLSILNALIIVPIVYNFSVLFLLFGGLSEKSPNYLIIIGGCVYVIGSIIFLLKSIWRIIRHKKVLKIIFVGIILFLIISNTISYFNTRNSLNKQREKLNSTTQNSITQLKEAEIISNPSFSSNDIELAIKNVYYHDDYVYIKFYLNNKTSDKYYNFEINKMKINYIQVAFENDVFSNFSKVSSWVGPLNSSNSYGILIRNNELEKRGIKKDKISSISFNFAIYSSKTNSENYDDFVSFDNYYDVILKK